VDQFLVEREKMEKVEREKMVRGDYQAAIGVGFLCGFVVGLIFMGVFAGLVGWSYHCEIRRFRADAVGFGYGEWVTGKGGDPGFGWKVPVGGSVDGKGE
jgi:hypothetical protein